MFRYFIDASVVIAYIHHNELKLPMKSMKNLKELRREVSRTLVSSAIVVSRRKKKRQANGIQNKKLFVPKSLRLESSAHQLER